MEKGMSGVNCLFKNSVKRCLCSYGVKTETYRLVARPLVILCFVHQEVILPRSLSWNVDLTDPLSLCAQISVLGDGSLKSCIFLEAQ